MPKSKRKTNSASVPVKRSNRLVPTNIKYEEDSSNLDYDPIVMLPNADDSGDSDESESDEEEVDDSKTCDTLPRISYEKAVENYTENQQKLEIHHNYVWVEGEKECHGNVQNEILLTDAQKIKIRNLQPVELFETFFSTEIKNYIIEATKENDYDLTILDLNTFIGIIILSSFNKRKSQRDYWSSDPYLQCQVASSAISCDNFEMIKSKMKYSKFSDVDPNDREWRIRFLLNEFRKNIKKFGFFETRLSIDEMMAKSYARTVLKQFIRGKPIRFGFKLWALCTADGYLLDLDLYCGKNSSIGNNLLAKCALGSRIVMSLLK